MAVATRRGFAGHARKRVARCVAVCGAAMVLALGGVVVSGDDARSADDASRIVPDYNVGENRERFEETSRKLDALKRAAPPVLSQQTLYFTQQAISRYEAIAARGGWQPIRSRDILRLGMNRPGVVEVRRRLIATGDLDPRLHSSRIFDAGLRSAVRRFQLRHGLITDGAVGRETREAMNVSVEERLQQLRTNAVRLTAMGTELGQRYVMVNIPGAEIEAVEDGVVAGRHTAIVGKIDRPTPLVASRISEINFNPFWHAPKSIVRRDIIPRMRQDPNYLNRYRIRIYDAGGNEIDPQLVNWETEEAVDYLLRQDPGELNSMGSIRINFHNKHSVYLHDTPQQSLFGANYRFHSSGCVRVHNVRDLVTWLLTPNGDWSRQSVDTTIASGERIDARLSLRTPIYMTYITAWGGPNGEVYFRPDVYKRDAAGDLAIAGQDS